MNPEELQKAIDMLTRLKAYLTPENRDLMDKVITEIQTPKLPEANVQNITIRH